jgi:hypothetical protein
MFGAANEADPIPWPAAEAGSRTCSPNMVDARAEIEIVPDTNPWLTNETNEFPDTLTCAAMIAEKLELPIAETKTALDAIDPN